MATVVHYVERWLELSAGFVDAHIRGSRHRGVVVSRGPFVNREAFPWRPAHTLDMLDRRAHGRLRRPALAAAVGGLAARHGARCVH
ncbi:MAG TPA: hypothetical protein VNE21_09165, partial [Mycobacteriales bacterium]|nr:hypothetical protein [Mycobacteriales bacterium]